MEQRAHTNLKPDTLKNRGSSPRTDGRTGEPAAAAPCPTPRCIIEVCSGEDSKLGDVSRSTAAGCQVSRFTPNNDFNQSENGRKAVDFASRFQHVLIWASLPCTGGTPWNFINNKIPSARKKVANHRKLFNVLWKSFGAFLDEMGHQNPSIAIEWPKGCTYWKLPKVKSILDKHGLNKCDFDGCAVGIVNAEGTY